MYVPSSPSLRPWVLVWPRTQTHNIPSTLQSNTLLTAALSNPYLWGIHLNLICVSKTLKWSSLNKILILNYLLSFLWNAYSTNPSKQYLYLKMTPKGSVSVTRNNYLQAGHLCFPSMFFIIKFDVWMFVSHVLGFCHNKVAYRCLSFLTK